MGLRLLVLYLAESHRGNRQRVGTSLSLECRSDSVRIENLRSRNQAAMENRMDLGEIPTATATSHKVTEVPVRGRVASPVRQVYPITVHHRPVFRTPKVRQRVRLTPAKDQTKEITMWTNPWNPKCSPVDAGGSVNREPVSGLRGKFALMSRKINC